MPGPPPLPSARGPRPVGAVPPPLPGQRDREFDTNAPRQSGRDQLFLPRGDLFGVWIACNSTNVNRIRCDQDTDRDGNRLKTGTVLIEFLDLSEYRYAPVALNDFVDLATSSSKGRFVRYHVIPNWPTPTKLRGPQRSAAEVAAIARSRDPRNASQARRYFNVGGRHRAGGGTPSRGPRIG
jgi:hypothetical protein